jgi:DNA sulfur modification protein DndE
MLPNRLRISKQATDSLRLLKSRTGLTPNLLCRAALVISLEEGASAGERQTDLEGSELNLGTLFGDNVGVYECLIRQVHGNVEGRTLNVLIAAHVDSGIDLLKKSRSLGDFVRHSVGTLDRGVKRPTQGVD